MGFWVRIKGYPLYEINRDGVIRSLRNGKVKVLKPCDNGNGYPRVNLYSKGLVRKQFVHRLVAITFVPNPKGLPQVHHKDHDKSNYRASNLAWTTSKENNGYKVVYYRNQKKV